MTVIPECICKCSNRTPLYSQKMFNMTVSRRFTFFFFFVKLPRRRGTGLVAPLTGYLGIKWCTHDSSTVAILLRNVWPYSSKRCWSPHAESHKSFKYQTTLHSSRIHCSSHRVVSFLQQFRDIDTVITSPERTYIVKVGRLHHFVCLTRTVGVM